MKRFLVVTVLALLVVSACDRGRDDPPPPTTTQRVQRPPVDTTRAVDPEAGVPGAVRPGDAERRAAATPTPPASSPATGARLYTVQVAAFREDASARALEQRLQQQGVPVWTTRTRVGDLEFTRVRVGATGSLAEARRLGQRIRQQYNWPVWVDRVRPQDQPPGDAVQTTRSYLGG